MSKSINMSNFNDLANDRMKHMEEYFTAKADLERVAQENAALRAENQKLSDQLAEKDTALQNLFSYIHAGV